jgi:hypothetical protein
MAQENQTQTQREKQKGKAPQKDMVDAWIGVSIWSIILGGLFPGAWWAGIIVFICWVSAIGKTIHFLQHYDLTNTFEYSTTKKQLTDAWIGAIIISIVFNAIIFLGVWWLQIFISILFIKALETTFTYYKTCEQEKNHTPISVPSIMQTQVVGSNPQYIIAQIDNESGKNVGIRPQEVQASYCALCGQERTNGAKFCAACGYQF